MSGLVRNGKTEPVSRDQILRHERGQGTLFFLVHLTASRISNHTRLIHTLLNVLIIRTCKHTVHILSIFNPYEYLLQTKQSSVSWRHVETSGGAREVVNGPEVPNSDAFKRGKCT